MNSPRVEAGSLSEITQLASHPPKYPRNPTEVKREPLTLYVARVPGSRDIILTTLKPQIKNVTVEDVASSLYYLHLNTEDDARFLQEDSSEAQAEKPPIRLQKPLPRKPLPESSRSSLDSLSYLKATLPPAESQPSSTLPRRKPVQHEKTLPEPPHVASRPGETGMRRPLGPRPFLSESNFPGPSSTDTELASSISRVLDFNSNLHTGSESDRSSRSPLGTPFGNETTAFEKSYRSFSITVIRRDPSSGAQWNIGTLAGQPVPNLSPADSQGGRNHGKARTKKPYFDITINLTTPGYGNFRSPQATNHVGGGQQKSTPVQGIEGGVAKTGTQPYSPPGFERHVQMEGASFWSRSALQHKRAHSEGLGKHGITRGRSASGSSAVGDLDSPTKPQLARDSGESDSKGYIFLSPWGGRCKFSTGSGGRSLRCKHTLPTPVSSTSSTDFSASHSSVTISELRFNLPSAKVFTSPIGHKKAGIETNRFSIPKIGHIRNKLSSQKGLPVLPPRPDPTSYVAMYPSDEDEHSPLPPRPYSMSAAPRSSDEYPSSPERLNLPPRPSDHPSLFDAYEDPHFDLSMGQEKAGGGNRGKRAKLGKLIIQNEGFKMLDLVVAANMGVWWSVWNSDQI